METSSDKTLWDDPDKDYRQRYEFPEQFLWDIASQPRIAWDGYMSVALGLLPAPPARVLDVGCGPGLGARLLCERGYEVEGVDYNERAIAFANLLVPQANFTQMDIRKLDNQRSFHGKFDAVIHVEVIEHIPPEFHSVVIQGIGKTLHQDGTLILTGPSVNLPLNKWHYKHFELEEITAMVNTNGFVVNRVIYQDRRSRLFSKLTWRLLSNRLYDLRIGRRLLRKLYLSQFNTTSNPDKAGRYIVQAIKTS